MKAFLLTTKLFLIFLLTLSFLIIQECTAFQNNDSSYREIIETLSSDSFYGRSVFKEGKNKSAQFLKSYLLTQSPKELLFKEFSFDTTFNQISRVSLSSNGVVLKLEEQFLPSGSSPNIEAEKRIHSFSDSDFKKENLPIVLNKKLNGDFALIKNQRQVDNQSNLSLSEKNSILSYIGASAIFIESNALLFSPSVFQDNFPVVWIRSELLFDNDTISLEIKSTIKQYVVKNLLVTPKEINKESALTVMAHYDHLGTINNNLIFNGANDNASGVAVAIHLFLESLSRTNQTQLILTDAEELGLLGSKALQASNEFHPISFLINIDMLGSETKGLAIVGLKDNSLTKEKLQFLADSLLIPIKFRANSPNSDHYFFLESGLRGFYIYSNEGTQPYHSSNDDYKTLDYNFLIKSEDFLKRLLVYLGH